MDALQLSEFETATIGLLVYLAGFEITQRVRFLRDFNVPEPVSAGLIASLATWLIYMVFDLKVVFDLDLRDYLLVLFFTGIGYKSRLSDLLRGGKPLVLLAMMTVAAIVLQNVIGVAGALLFDLPAAFGVSMGSAALIGGHGTVIAWSPAIAEASGISGVAEAGIAVATIGLVLAGLVGGPTAKYLIEKNNLSPSGETSQDVVGQGYEKEFDATITHIGLMRALLFIHIGIGLGYVCQQVLAELGLSLPLFVPAMIVGIIIGNIVVSTDKLRFDPHRSTALAVITDFGLGVFLAMSLMSMQLWSLQGMGAMLGVVLAAQVAASVLFVFFVLFRVMGRDYFAAVLASGYLGFQLGATPTAIANMTAVTKRYGPAPLAFVILPLITAFFTGIANSIVIRMFLEL